MYIYMCVYIYMHMYIYMLIYVYIYMHMYIYQVYEASEKSTGPRLCGHVAGVSSSSRIRLTHGSAPAALAKASQAASTSACSRAEAEVAGRVCRSAFLQPIWRPKGVPISV